MHLNGDYVGEQIKRTSIENLKHLATAGCFCYNVLNLVGDITTLDGVVFVCYSIYASNT